MNRRLDLRLDPPNLGTIQLRGPRYTPDVVKQGRHVHRSSAVCEICDAPWACYKHAYVHAGRISVACIHEAKDVVRGQCVHGGVELPRAFDPASDRRVYPRDEAREWRPRSRRHLQGFHHRLSSYHLLYSYLSRLFSSHLYTRTRVSQHGLFINRASSSLTFRKPRRDLPFRHFSNHSVSDESL